MQEILHCLFFGSLISATFNYVYVRLHVCRFHFEFVRDLYIYLFFTTKNVFIYALTCLGTFFDSRKRRFPAAEDVNSVEVLSIAYVHSLPLKTLSRGRRMSCFRHTLTTGGETYSQSYPFCRSQP